MKKFFQEFKKFITRGNVIDMAVGVIVGGAFTAIITAFTTQIFQPLVNWALSGTGGGLEDAVTMLKPVYDQNGAIDMASSIYINWGAVVTAILNFFIIALILFSVIKGINALHEVATPKCFGYSKTEYIKMRREGKTREEIAAMADERDKCAAEKKAAEEAEAKKHTAEALLEDIKAILEKQVGDKEEK